MTESFDRLDKLLKLATHVVVIAKLYREAVLHQAPTREIFGEELDKAILAIEFELGIERKVPNVPPVS